MTRLPLTSLLFAVLVAAVVGCGGKSPPPSPAQGLSIGYPLAGQSLAGTVGVVAAGYGGTAVDVAFEIGGLRVSAVADGIAYLDTRALDDGPYVPKATATVGSAGVEDAITVTIDNDLAHSARVGPGGGSVMSATGSIATVPVGALSSQTTVSAQDVTETEILAEFGIDYSAMGVTFLGALEVDTAGAAPTLPLAVDLVGWAQAVQPEQSVVMFVLAPDADGDGQGELMFGSNAVATPGGSIVTTPTPRSEAYGFQAAGSLGVQATTSARPGEILTLSGRGFNSLSPLSNAVRYGSAAAPTLETLLLATLTSSQTSNPLQELSLAVPALTPGSHQLRLHNLTTGHVTEALDVSVAPPGGADQQTWQGFVAQVSTAAAALATSGEFGPRADPWLATLEATTSEVLAAMANNSRLVSPANSQRLAALDPGSLSSSDRELVARHALVLDAMAASTGVDAAVADAAADLATLLMVSAYAHALPTTTSLTGQQASGPSCSGGAPSPTSISWGQPVTTGMGAAPPGSCGAGGATGDGAGGGSLRALAAAGQLEPDTLATTSLRRGSFGPMSRAVIKVLRPGSETVLAPFTALSDATGYFFVPFLPPNEPFVLRAYHPATGQVAEATGVSRGSMQVTSVQLVFEPRLQGPGAPSAAFELVPVPDDRFDGTVFYTFDASASTDDQEIVEYVWDFGGASASIDWQTTVHRGYGRNGTYSVRLTVFDEDGNFDSVVRSFTIDDLPYDYWSGPPVRVTQTQEGEPIAAEYAALSGSGRYVAFATEAAGLSPFDTNSALDVYLKDMDTGAIELVSSDVDGLAVGSDDWPLISDDVRYVAFDLPDDRVGVKDRQTGSLTVLVNPDGFGRNSVAAISRDGRTVAYEASTLNVSLRGIYVVDLDTMETTRVGRNLADDAWVRLSIADLSADGRYLVFRSSSGELVEGDLNGVEDVFRFDRETGEVAIVSVAQDGTFGDGVSSAWGRVITSDGRYVTFWSDATNWPGAGDNDGQDWNAVVEDVWVKDMETGELTLVNTNAKGHASDDDAVLSVISADGRYVAFGSYAENLTPVTDPYDPCDLNMCPSGFSYVKDLVTGRVVNVTVGMEDALADDWDQIEPSISADGRYILYYSWANNLVPADGDGSWDHFRVENPLWEP